MKVKICVQKSPHKGLFIGSAFGEKIN